MALRNRLEGVASLRLWYQGIRDMIVYAVFYLS